MSRVGHYFDLADAAYDAEAIRTASIELGAVPIIDRNQRNSGKDPEPMSPTAAMVYKLRTSVERFFSHLLDSHGGRTVRVRAPERVAQHLMYGVVVIAIEQLMRMTC